MKSIQRPISQIDFERRALKAKLAFSRKDDATSEGLLRQIEDCALLIAAAPADSIEDMAIKFELLLEVLAFDSGSANMSLEGVLLLALKKDFENMTCT